MGPDGFGGPPGGSSRMTESEVKSFAGKDGVIIQIEQNRRPMMEVVQKLKSVLGVSDHAALESNGKLLIGLKYTGSIHTAASHIDFGSVYSVNEAERTIFVRGL